MMFANKKTTAQTTEKRLSYAVAFGEPSGIRTPDTLIKRQILGPYHPSTSAQTAISCDFCKPTILNRGSQKVVNWFLTAAPRKNTFQFFRQLSIHPHAPNGYKFPPSSVWRNGPKDIELYGDPRLHDIE